MMQRYPLENPLHKEQNEFIIVHIEFEVVVGRPRVWNGFQGASWSGVWMKIRAGNINMEVSSIEEHFY